MQRNLHVLILTAALLTTTHTALGRSAPVSDTIEGTVTLPIDSLPLLSGAELQKALDADRAAALRAQARTQAAITADTLSRPAASQFDNSGWEPGLAYPGGLQNYSALATAGRYVYVAISFGREVGKEQVDGKLARWDGERWIGLGDKLPSPPAAIAAIGEDLYVAGEFESIGGKNIAGVAKWSGATGQWSAVGSGVGPREPIGNETSPTASDIAVVSNTVYIAGEFTTVDGAEIYHAARFNGTSWSALGNGFYNEPIGRNGEVSTIDALPDGRVLIGGKFTHFYTNPTGNAITAARGVALWNPQNNALESAGGLSADAVVNDILATDDGFLVGGAFQTAGGVTVNGIAAWSASGWRAFGAGLGNGAVNAIARRGTIIMVGGSFGTIGGQAAHRIARWNGTAWTGLDTTNNNEDSVFGIGATSNGDFYVAGDFDVLGGLDGNNIMRYSETQARWRTVGEGLADTSLSGDITAMHVLADGRVIVSGDFLSAGGVAVENLAIWDPIGREWAAWGSGADGPVNVFTKIGNDLYVGGAFNRIGGITASRIAIYDLVAGTWRTPGVLDAAVLAIAPAHDGLIYIGGVFTRTPAGEVDRFVLYNPANGEWVRPPFGLDNVSTFYTPRLFEFLPDARGVWISGNFFRLRINGQLTADRFNSLVYWDRTTGELSRFGTGATQQNDTLGSISSMARAPDGQIFFGGEYSAFVSVAANGAARLVGGGWQAMGSGVTATSPNDNRIIDMTLAGKCLFVGGDFGRAGNTSSSRAAIWDLRVNDWVALGDGIGGGDLDSQVVALASAPGRVYFGGEFWYAGDGQSGSFAAWNLVPQTPSGPAQPDNPALTFKVRLPFAAKSPGVGALGGCA
jgi:trimeric autotransporter adhesin